MNGWTVKSGADFDWTSHVGLSGGYLSPGESDSVRLFLCADWTNRHVPDCGRWHLLLRVGGNLQLCSHWTRITGGNSPKFPLILQLQDQNQKLDLDLDLVRYWGFFPASLSVVPAESGALYAQRGGDAARSGVSLTAVKCCSVNRWSRSWMFRLTCRKSFAFSLSSSLNWRASSRDQKN